jgi:putative PIN family toxin of toxin-antitoxin system
VSESKVRIVPDVNVIISAIIAPSGTPGRIYDAWKRRDIQIITSPVIISKTLEVIQRPHIQNTFSLTQADFQNLKSLLEHRTLLTPHLLDLQVVKQDPEDDTIIIAAVESNADCIVSGDKHLKELGSYQNIPILSPLEFVTQHNIV